MGYTSSSKNHNPVLMAVIALVCAALATAVVAPAAYAADAALVAGDAATASSSATVGATASTKALSYDTIWNSSGSFVTWYHKNDSESNYWMWEREGKRITAAKSSNTSVAAIGNVDGAMGMRVKKAGKTTITYKVNGKKHTINLTVQNYVPPAKSFQIGSVSGMSSFSKERRFHASKKALFGKVKIAPAQGWVLESISALSANSTKAKRLKSGSTVKKADKITDVTAVFRHRGTGAHMTLSLTGVVAKPAKLAAPKLGNWVMTDNGSWHTPRADGAEYTIKWNKVKGASGYQVQFGMLKGSWNSSRQSFQKGCSYVWRGSGGQGIRIKVRAYKLVNGKKVYSAWSTYKTKRWA